VDRTDRSDDESQDKIGDETKNEIRDETKEDENRIEDIKTYKKSHFFISYYSHNNDWSNTRVIKTATNLDNF